METVAKNRIEFQWGSKLQGTSSEVLVFHVFTSNVPAMLAYSTLVAYLIRGKLLKIARIIQRLRFFSLIIVFLARNYAYFRHACCIQHACLDIIKGVKSPSADFLFQNCVEST